MVERRTQAGDVEVGELHVARLPPERRRDRPYDAPMDVQVVDDLDDPRLDDYRDLRHRHPRGTGPVIVESLLAVEALATSALTIRSVLVSPQRLPRLPPLADDVPVLVAELGLQRATVGFELHRGVVASAERPPARDPGPLLDGARRVVIAERMNDLENLGSLFRNARAFGVDAVLLDPETTDPFGRRPVRVSLGHVLHVPFARLAPWPDALRRVRDAGLGVAALTTEGDVGLDALPARVALLVGAEGDGLTERALHTADLRVRIPMAPAVDSLNVATAAAIAMSAHFSLDTRR
jgi:tRNA G18 (ribose-2'-O)-methylase SpoU